jgi:hypothetical protein
MVVVINVSLLIYARFSDEEGCTFTIILARISVSNEINGG